MLSSLFVKRGDHQSPFEDSEGFAVLMLRRSLFYHFGKTEKTLDAGLEPLRIFGWSWAVLDSLTGQAGLIRAE